MSRKVVKHGLTTLTISLPSKWCKENKVIEGMELEVIEESNNLKIFAKCLKSRDKNARINYPNKVDFLKRVVINLYRKGYEEIVITSKEKIPRSRISSKIIELPGFEVVEHTDNKLIIKNVSIPQEEDFEIIFRRLYRVALNFSTEVFNALQKENYSELKDIYLLDKEVNKLYNFCMRIINQKFEEFKEKGPIYVQTINYLEQIGDQLDELCHEFSNKSIKLSKNSLKVFEEIVKYFERIYQLSFDFNYAELLVAEKNREKLFMDIKKNLGYSKKAEDTILISYLHIILECLFHIETYMLNVEDHLSI